MTTDPLTLVGQWLSSPATIISFFLAGSLTALAWVLLNLDRLRGIGHEPIPPSADPRTFSPAYQDLRFSQFERRLRQLEAAHRRTGWSLAPPPRSPASTPARYTELGEGCVLALPLSLSPAEVGEVLAHHLRSCDARYHAVVRASGLS